MKRAELGCSIRLTLKTNDLGVHGIQHPANRLVRQFRPSKPTKSRSNESTVESGRGEMTFGVVNSRMIR